MLTFKYLLPLVYKFWFIEMLKKIFITCFITLLIAFIPNSYAKSSKQDSARVTNAQITPGALNGVAYSLNGNDYGYNQDQYFRPASTEKIITALAALIYLGPNYSIETQLKVEPSAIFEQKSLKVQNHTLYSDVEFEFRGDPSLKRAHLSSLISPLQKQGITTIHGNIYVNYGYFAGHDYASGWSWDDLSKCFTAPPSAIIIDNNCISIQLIGTRIGQKPTVRLPENLPIKVNVDDVEVVAPNEYYGGCELEVDRNSENNYVFSGCIPVQKPNQPLGLSLAIQDPNDWGVKIIEQLLRKANIKVTGSVIAVRKSVKEFKSYARYKSKPLSKLLYTCLHKSVNLIADSLAKTIGTVYYKRPANYYLATSAIYNILKKEKIDLGNATIIDGSGLSPHNYITPRQMLNILKYIQKNDSKLNLIKLLPVAGMNGTLAGRGSVMKAPLLKNVTAKTGTLNGVANLAGFMTTSTGKLAPFVYFMNNLSYDKRTRQRIESHRMAKPHCKHERMILEHIYDEKIITHE